MSALRQTPLTCSGHTRPVVFLAFSEINSEGQYCSISACKDGKTLKSDLSDVLRLLYLARCLQFFSINLISYRP